jgi:hypothetical protein
MIDISTRRRGRRALRLIAAPVGLVALVGLAACGTGTDSSTGAATGESAPSAAPAAAGGPSDSAMAAYTSCLAENGVTLPARPARGGSGGGAPGQAPEGVDADTWTAAQQACADVAPTPPDGGGPAGTGT